MSSHKFTDEMLTSFPPKYQSRCRCGFVTKQHRHEWQVSDEKRAHLAFIERVKTYLNKRDPSVKNQYDYYSERANDPEETPANRALWQQLADELRPRVPDKSKNGEQETLFPMETPEKTVNRSNQT